MCVLEGGAGDGHRRAPSKAIYHKALPWAEGFYVYFLFVIFFFFLE